MKKLYHAFLVVVLFSFSSVVSTAQSIETDTLTQEDTITSSLSLDTIDAGNTKEKKGSIFTGRPGKAMMLSLILPGTGQIYNKSYLRVPFVYAAVGGMGYLLYNNTRVYNCRKEAYIASVDGLPPNLPEYCTECDKGLEDVTDPATLRVLRDEANKARQLSIVGFTLVWLLNGIDAYVDAHLKDFDIDDNLSFEIGTKFDDPNAPTRIGLFVQF